MVFNKKLRQISLLTLLCLYFYCGECQKLPEIQEVSVRAPANIKIDGLVKEWPNPYLNAYNSASRLYYVVSNDDNNLYFTLRGLGGLAAQKALTGGITFTISHSTERKTRMKAKGNITITFPTPQTEDVVKNIMGPVLSITGFLKDTSTNKKQIDSLVALTNNRIIIVLKQIFLTGATELPDSVLSIYNSEGIKAAAQFIKKQLVIELAIPLKYLGLSIDNPVSFSYNIKLTGPREQLNAGSTAPSTTISEIEFAGPGQLYFNSVTDFWGTYTLAKKK